MLLRTFFHSYHAKKATSMGAISDYDQFCEDAFLNRKYDPYLVRRSDVERYRENNQLEFAWFMIIDSHPQWWYAPYIGFEFLGLLPGKYGSRDIKPTRSIGHTKIVLGRGILPSHLIML